MVSKRNQRANEEINRQWKSWRGNINEVRPHANGSPPSSIMRSTRIIYGRIFTSLSNAL